MHSTDQQLSGEGLTCERGGRVLFSKIDFSVKSGQALIVQGQNGAGKTSLLRIMVGLSMAEEGVVRWNHAAGKLCDVGLPAVEVVEM